MEKMPVAAVIGGGTVYHVRPHLALAAPAYGATARRIHNLLSERFAAAGYDSHLHLTRMAGGDSLETNDDVARLVDGLVASPDVHMIFMPVALCDFEGAVVEPGGATPSGKDQPRLRSDRPHGVALTGADKLIGRIRRQRKDIFLVGFKTTAGASEDEQFAAGLRLLKASSCNLVLANDLHTRRNMIVTPEQARYCVTSDRDEAIVELVAMALERSGLTFTPTTVSAGLRLPWSDASVPATFRTVVDYCVERGAYKPFAGVTVGHFAFRAGEHTLMSSCRKQDFNGEEGRALVRVDFEADRVIAHGAKPSAGARSQWEVLERFPEWDCIIHFHCPMKRGATLSVRSQRAFECGSHECGANTAAGMTIESHYGGELRLGAVMLDKHGPNILFHSASDPRLICLWIDEHFDLSRSTGDE